MNGSTGNQTVHTMRNVTRSTNAATEAMNGYLTVISNVQNAMRRMNTTSFTGQSSFGRQLLLEGQTQEPIYTEFVDADDDLQHVDSSIVNARDNAKSFGEVLRSIIDPLKTVSVQLGSVFVTGAKKAGTAIGGFVTGLLRIAKFRIFRTMIKDLGQSFKDLYGWSNLFGTEFSDSMDRITTASTYLRNSIAAMAAPLVNALAPALDFNIDMVVEVLNWFNQLFAALSGADTYTVAKKVATSFGDAISSAGSSAKKAADEFKRTILGFDEINKLMADRDKSGGGSGSSPYSSAYQTMFEEKELTGGFKGFSDAIEKALDNTLSRIG